MSERTTGSTPVGGAVPPAASPSQDKLLELLRHATLGEYDIAGELGHGGMATVFLAHDLSLGRKVAIKVMSPALGLGPGMTERFKREARTAAASGSGPREGPSSRPTCWSRSGGVGSRPGSSGPPESI
jgi:serine/threonine protein kinase